MSHQNRLPRWLSADRLDTTLPAGVGRYLPSAVFSLDGNPPQSVLAPTVSPDRVCSPARNRVYTNDEVTMCTSSSVTEGSL